MLLLLSAEVTLQQKNLKLYFSCHKAHQLTACIRLVSLANIRLWWKNLTIREHRIHADVMRNHASSIPLSKDNL